MTNVACTSKLNWSFVLGNNATCVCYSHNSISRAYYNSIHGISLYAPWYFIKHNSDLMGYWLNVPFYSKSWIIFTVIIPTILCFPIDFDVWIICTFCLIHTKFSRIFVRIIRISLYYSFVHLIFCSNEKCPSRLAFSISLLQSRCIVEYVIVGNRSTTSSISGGRI